MIPKDEVQILMPKIITWLTLLFTIVLSGSACTAGTGGTATIASSQNGVKELKFKVPDGWISEKPSSGMRVAQYKLPKPTQEQEQLLLAS